MFFLGERKTWDRFSGRRDEALNDVLAFALPPLRLNLFNRRQREGYRTALSKRRRFALLSIGRGRGPHGMGGEPPTSSPEI